MSSLHHQACFVPRAVSFSSIAILLLVLVLQENIPDVACFAPRSSSSYLTRSREHVRSFGTTPLPRFAKRGGDNSDSDFPLEEETTYEGAVDWDAEWKKVVENQKSGKSSSSSFPSSESDRPGKDYYKSDAEIAAIRAANKATKEAEKLAQRMPQLPSFSSLQYDWKFWVGVLLVVSFGLSLLTAQAPIENAATIKSADSYFI